MEPEQQTPPQIPNDDRYQGATQPQVYQTHSPRKKQLAILGLLLAAVLIAIGVYWWVNKDDGTVGTTTDQPATQVPATDTTEIPELTTETVVQGRNRVWDIAFLPTKEMLFTERSGTVSALVDGSVRKVADINDVVAQGEGGLLGMAVDPNFASNRYIYTCFNTDHDIRVVRWVLAANLGSLGSRTDIVTDMPKNPSGRHSGCRLAFGTDGYLWIGTGDTAQNITPQTPQDPKSLGGKILRVDRNGKAAPGNLGGIFDSRIYSYGHRNTQGIAFFKEPIDGVPGISVEHGSDVDDEVNLLKQGNFGWAPHDGPYDESVPMTDKDRFPDAISAIWSSGNPTQAPSGAAVVYGSQWKAWDGAIVVAVLKDKHLKFLTIDDKLAVTKEDKRLQDEFGRIRAVRQGPDGSLYISTDNAVDDKIIKVTPK